MSVESPFLSVRDFATLLGVSQKLVYNAIYRNEIPHIRFGGIYRIHRDVILTMTVEDKPKRKPRGHVARMRQEALVSPEPAPAETEA